MRKEYVVFESHDIKVRIMELASNARSPWHHHSTVKDTCICLEGEITVYTRDPEKTISLVVGQQCIIDAGIEHCIQHAAGPEAKYLLIQGVGQYDFIADSQ